MTQPGPDLGLDIGATLAKIARQERGNGAAAEFEFLPSSDLRAVADRVVQLSPARTGITGGGAARRVWPRLLRTRRGAGPGLS